MRGLPTHALITTSTNNKDAQIAKHILKAAKPGTDIHQGHSIEISGMQSRLEHSIYIYEDMPMKLLLRKAPYRSSLCSN